MSAFLLDFDIWRAINGHMTQVYKEPELKVVFFSNWSEVRHKSLSDHWFVAKQMENPRDRWTTVYANLTGQKTLLQDVKSARVDVLIRGLGKGLPSEVIDRVRYLMGINQTRLTQILDISTRTLSRRQTLKASTSERLFRVCNLFQRALEVLGDWDEAQRWFTTPKKALGGKTPLEYSESEVGTREVEDLLGRIEYGVYS